MMHVYNENINFAWLQCVERQLPIRVPISISHAERYFNPSGHEIKNTLLHRRMLLFPFQVRRRDVV